MSSQHLSTAEADFKAIEAAVMETSRGRWFLSEYSKRNRHANTQSLLEAISQLEELLKDRERHTEANLRLVGEMLSSIMVVLQAKLGTRASYYANNETAVAFGRWTQS